LRPNRRSTDLRCRRSHLSLAGWPRAAPWRDPWLHPMDASHLYSSRVYPPKPAKQASTTDSFVSFVDPVALLALHPVSYCPTSDLQSDKTTPTQNFVRGTANCIPRESAR